MKRSLAPPVTLDGLNQVAMRQAVTGLKWSLTNSVTEVAVRTRLLMLVSYPMMIVIAWRVSRTIVKFLQKKVIDLWSDLSINASV